MKIKSIQTQTIIRCLVRLKKFTVPVIVHFGYSDDHPETDSGWDLRKHETSDNSSSKTTPTSKFLPPLALHASRSDCIDRDQECMSSSRCRSLFPDSTDRDTEAVIESISGDDNLRSVPLKRIRIVSEVMQLLIRPSQPSLVAAPSELKSVNEGSSSSTSSERTSTSTFPISSSTWKTVSKD